MKKIVVSITLLFLFMTLAQADDEKLAVTTINGGKFHIEITPDKILFDEYKDRVVFIEVFAERCPHCIKAIPTYNELYNKFPKKLGIITIEAGGLDDENLKDFIELYDIEYPTAAAYASEKLLDLVIKRGKSPGWVPFLLVLDKDGKIHTTKIGPTTKSDLEKIIVELSK